MKTHKERIEEIMSMTDDAYTLKSVIKYLLKGIENEWSDSVIVSEELAIKYIKK